MISSGFTWVPIGGLGESNITLRGLFYKNMGVTWRLSDCEVFDRVNLSTRWN